MKYQLTTIRNWDDITTLKGVWNDLVREDIESTLFQRFEWYDAWWQAYAGEGYEPLAIIAAHDEEVVGIGPFMVNPSGTIEFLASPETEYQTIITHPEHRHACEQLLDELLTHSKKHTIQLDEIPTVNCAHQFLRTKLASLPHTRQANASLKSHSQTMLFDKSTVRRKLKKLKREGEVGCRILDPEESKSGLTQFFDWHDMRFGKSISRFRKRQLDEKFRQFYMNLIENLNNAGTKTYLAALTVNGEPTAMQFFIEEHDTMYYLLSTYHPDQYTCCSPGSILGQDMVNHAIRQNKTFDFLRGEEEYKYRFTNTTIPLVRYTIYPSYIKKSIASAQRLVKKLLKPIVVKAIARIRK